MTFAEELRRIRKSRAPAVSQEALAIEAANLDRTAPPEDRAVFSQQRVGEFERGPSRPSVRQRELLILALKCTADEESALRLAWEREELRGLPVVPIPPEFRQTHDLDDIEPIDLTQRPDRRKDVSLSDAVTEPG